ncbi:MAG: DUF420 domain-containing protein [Candidatus Bathyarchaeia archaeon]
MKEGASRAHKGILGFENIKPLIPNSPLGSVDIPTISLITQFAILALLLYGYALFRKGNLARHGQVLLAAVAIHTTAILAIMLPLFLASPTSYVPNLTTLMGLGNITHIVSGTIAEILAVYIVIRWIRNRLNPSGCRGKLIMRATMILWLISLLTGLGTYFIY